VSDRGWTYHPALKHASAFAFGILLASLSDIGIGVLLPCLSFGLLWIILAARDGRLILPAAVLVTVAAAGALSFVCRCHELRVEPAGFRGKGIEVCGRVAADPVYRNGRYEILLEPDSILFRNSSARLSGGILMRIFDSTASPSNLPSYGDLLTAGGAFRIPSGPDFPGAPDYRAILQRKGICATFDCYRRSELFVFGHSDGDGPTRMLRSIRRHIRYVVHTYIGGDEGAIALALTLGETDGIDPDTREAFARTGTAHVLAVSGLHVGILAVALFVVVAWVGNRWVRFFLFAAVLAGYVAVVGGRPSIVRASVMALLFLAAYNAGRIARPLNTLGLAGLILLVIDPGTLFDPGFQLSFGAVGGILLIYPPVWRWIGTRFHRFSSVPFARGLARLMLVSGCAQLATLPLMLHYFGYLSLVAPVVNLAVIPLIGIGLGSTVAAVLAGGVPLLGTWFGGTARLAIGLVTDLVRWVGSADRTGVAIPPPGWICAGVICVGILYLGLSRSPRTFGLRLISLATLCALAVGIDRHFDPLRRPAAPTVVLVPLSSSGGIATCVTERDTLTVYYGGIASRDSAVAAYVCASLAPHVGATSVRTVDITRLETEGPDVRSSTGLLNRFGPEIGVVSVPVVLSNTGERRLGLVSVDGTVVLQVPLQRRLERTVVLRPYPEWRLVEWR